jgi:hemin uptake protein HemP
MTFFDCSTPSRPSWRHRAAQARMNMAPQFTPLIDAPDDSRPVPVHDARSLTEGGMLARIALDGQTYLLRITRAGKLILTK